MESGFLGVPGVDGWLFAALTAGSFFTHFFGMVTGAAGGLMLLAFLATVFPPVIVVPMHTLVQLATNIGRVAIMWRYVVKDVLLPFLIGALIGALAGAQIFITLSAGVLQGIIALFILLASWLPSIAGMGTTRGRFSGVGFAATFLGVFVSATGTMVGPFVHHATPDRRNYVATFGALMAIMHTAKLAAFLSVGIALSAYAPLITALTAAGFAATWVGRMALDRIPERLFRTVFRFILTLLALRLLYVATRELGLFG
jgi:uncharacterized membrane protein YfcA